uniref:cyclin-dependent kinase n=1 Tax=Romanomermis culicivorax TaxID=13658 RepID=A0A915HPR1_ROMCU
MKGIHVSSQRLVALKKVRVKFSEEGVPQTVIREIALLKELERLDHDNVIRLYDVCHGISNEREFYINLIFEYCPYDLSVVIENIHYRLKPQGLEVITLWYRPPEVILQSGYHTSVDIFSLGCIFAELYLQTPLFKGASEKDQLQKIFQIIGLPPLYEWPHDALISRNTFPHYPKVPFSRVVPKMCGLALNLLEVSIVCFHKSKN